MILTPQVVLQAVLLVLGLVWCREMLRRWRADLAEWRETPDLATRLGIATPWLATAGVVLFVGSTLATLLGRFAGA